MATPEERRRLLRDALVRELEARRLSYSSEVVELFVERAMSHIDARWSNSSDRDAEAQRAVTSASIVARNLAAFAGRSVTLNESLSFISLRRGCVFPWCKPSP